MEDLFFPVPAVDVYDPLAEAYATDSWHEPVVAQRNPVADPYLNAVYDFRNHPESTAWLLDSGWAVMPEADRDGFVAAILEVFPDKVDALQTLYMSAFGRLGDPEGLAYWTLNMVNHLTNDPTDLLQTVINQSPEYVGMLQSVLADQPGIAGLKTGQAIESYIRTLDSTAQHSVFGKLVDNMYENIFGRSADTGGKDYWTGALERGSVNLLHIMGALINNAGAEDKALLAVKSDIAYDAVNALVDRHIITAQDIKNAGSEKITAALTNMQERLSEYDASERLVLQANRETLLAQLLKDAGLV